MTIELPTNIRVTDDGYLLAKSYNYKKITRIIDFESLGITEETVKKFNKDEFTKQNKFYDLQKNQKLRDYFYITIMLKYYKFPDELDIFVYYDDIGILSGSAGYLRIRDGYVYSKQVEIVS